jgi:hypothetical protein
MVGRTCTYQMADGRPCRATPMRAEPFCFWHAPETADELADAQRMGRLHRRKKRTVAAIYGFGGLRTIEDNQALLETITIETMALDNSIARNRALNAMLATGIRLVEIGELEARLEALEAAAGQRLHSTEDAAFPQENANDPKATPRRG